MQTTQMSRTCDMTKYIVNKIGLLGMQRIINNMKKAVYKTTWIIFPLKLKIKKGKRENPTNQIFGASFSLSVK